MECKKITFYENTKVLLCSLILIWALWFSLNALSNIFEYLYALNLLPSDWKFHSGNYAIIVKNLQVYNWSQHIGLFLFFWDVVFLIIITVLLWKTFCLFVCGQDKIKAWRFFNYAFGSGIILWGAFVILEEFFMSYINEPTHFRLYIAMLLTFVAAYLIKEKDY